MNLLWLHDDRRTFLTPVDKDYNPRERFENSELIIQGQISEIRQELSPKLLAYVDDEEWVHALSKTVSVVQKSHTVMY